MIITLIRGFILYIAIIICMRFMGKRQLGELQPTELVITILLSEIAAIPMQDNEIPMINSLLAVALLVSLEIINSVIIMKNTKIRYLLQGKPAVVIKDGKIDQKKLKKLRFTGDDILDQLRQKDIFDINEVQYAVIETNGSLSVMKNPENETPTVSQFGFKTEKRGIPVLAVNDGRYIDTAINESEEISKKTVEKILKKENADVKEVLIMLIDKYGNYTIIKKDEN
ncbi:MAG: DUF421 domain-containing protein [Oscillospiraceae bacterium]|nr:DUF421 domain-containing protein [Ruminococcus sp.]MDD7338112.1 DUF421 domain-containing protein [Ruminococcus sp.]MDY6061987.1 DUF421 domain-containing protein [Oscillospiraceae bacterium]